MSLGLDENIIQSLIRALAKYKQVKHAKIFGSRAEGNYKYNSDIDIAVYCEGDFPPELYLDLDDAAGIYKIDVVDVGKLHNDEIVHRSTLPA